MAEAKIVVLSGPGAGKEVTFRDSLILGRSRAAGLVLPHPTVSREHARIFFREGAWFVVDLKSRNGTRLGGKGITKSEIRDGDELLLGEVKLRFHLPGAEKKRGGEEEERKERGGGIQLEDPGEGLVPGGEEIRLEEDSRKGGLAQSSPDRGRPLSPPRPSLGEKGPVPPPGKARPGPLPARPAARRLGEGREDLLLKGRPKEGGGGLLGEDLSQWSGFAKFLAFLLGLALAAFLFYLAFRVVS